MTELIKCRKNGTRGMIIIEILKNCLYLVKMYLFYIDFIERAA